jgi:HAMP domain-containing protein
MQAFVLIVMALGLILLFLWRWDEHTRRVERHRRHLENRQRQGRATAP